jgi:hypothetical protein
MRRPDTTSADHAHADRPKWWHGDGSGVGTPFPAITIHPPALTTDSRGIPV